MRTRLVLLLLAGLLLANQAHAQTAVDTELATRSRLWPITINLQTLVGVEPQLGRAAPIAFGASGEVLWHGVVGGFVGLLSSSGTPIPASSDGQPSLADRISVPIALAWHPLAAYTTKARFIDRLAAGFGLQCGLSVEYLRTAADDAITVGFHLAGSLDIPLYGGPLEGGFALRLYGRFLAASDQLLDPNMSPVVFEPGLVGQFLAGLSYTL